MRWQDKLSRENLEHAKCWTIPRGVRFTKENVLFYVKSSKNCPQCDCIKNTLETK